MPRDPVKTFLADLNRCVARAPRSRLLGKGQSLNVSTKAERDLTCSLLSFFSNAGIWPRPCVIELM